MFFFRLICHENYDFDTRRRRAWKKLLCNDPWLIAQDQSGGGDTENPTVTLSYNIKVSCIELIYFSFLVF